MKRDQIRLGIIGAGAAVRKLHYPVLQAMAEELPVVAVCNQNRNNAEAFVRSMAVRAEVFNDYEALLESEAIDAVLISVPIALSGRVLSKAIAANKHVLSEKPLAATPEEGFEILDACSRTDNVVAIGENFRYRKDVKKARQVIATGEIGQPFSFQLTIWLDLEAESRQVWAERPWRKKPTHPGGFVLDAGIHAVCGLRDVLGDVKDVYAQIFRQSAATDGPDNLLMQVTMQNGAVGHCFASYTAKVPREVFFRLGVLGKEGSLEILDGEVSWGAGTGNLNSFRSDSTDRGYQAQWQNFVAAIHGREPLISSPEQAYEDLLVIDAALESAATGKNVSIASRKAKQRSKAG
jgi:predicted dehydrogenase